MVETLRKNGHTVAMTGDGVNDVLALKEADVSIAMADGCDAAKQISNIVLLENDFKNLYDIIMEGRRVFNNIQRVSTMFLQKTFMSIIFAAVTIFTAFKFPFIPIQLTLISSLTIGIPGFVLTFEKSRKRIKEHFMTDVITKSFVTAFILTMMTILLSLVGQKHLGYTPQVISTMSTYLAFVSGMGLVVMASRPIRGYKLFLIVFLVIMMAIVTIFFKDFFQLVALTNIQWLHMALVSAILLIILTISIMLINREVF